MQKENWIPAGVFCEYHQADISFIEHLHESGLIDMTQQDGIIYLSSSELPALEKFIRWHYELAINTEGIEAIAHLLDRVQLLQDQNRKLLNRLGRFDQAVRPYDESTGEV